VTGADVSAGACHTNTTSVALDRSTVSGAARCRRISTGGAALTPGNGSNTAAARLHSTHQQQICCARRPICVPRFHDFIDLPPDTITQHTVGPVFDRTILAGEIRHVDNVTYGKSEVRLKTGQSSPARSVTLIT
jgi:hypothetical protein